MLKNVSQLRIVIISVFKLLLTPWGFYLFIPAADGAYFVCCLADDYMVSGWDGIGTRSFCLVTFFLAIYALALAAWLS